jgi:hypothetical protein
VRRGRDPVLLLGDQRDALGDPRVLDELSRLAFQRGEHGVHRRAQAREDRPGVGVDELGELGELVAVTAAKPAHLGG